MKQGIHPEWYAEAVVTCACGNSWTTGATISEIRTDVCSQCHPFYTGEQRIVDTEGQVDRFLKRLEARQSILSEKDQIEAEKTSPDIPLDEMELGNRNVKALAEAGITTAGDFLALLKEGGDEAALAIKGFGAKGLVDLKRALRGRGYELPIEEA